MNSSSGRCEVCDRPHPSCTVLRTRTCPECRLQFMLPADVHLTAHDVATAKRALALQIEMNKPLEPNDERSTN